MGVRRQLAQPQAPISELNVASQYMISPAAIESSIGTVHDHPCLASLVDALDGLPVRLAVVVPDKRWGDDPCGTCPEPRHGGPENPEPAVAYIRRDFTVGTVVATFREPVCETCLRSAVRWEINHRGADKVHVDLIAGAA